MTKQDVIITTMWVINGYMLVFLAMGSIATHMAKRALRKEKNNGSNKN